jgi:hypothetical protein
VRTIQNTLCGQNAEFWFVKAGGTYSNYWALKDLVVASEYKYQNEQRINHLSGLNN